MQRSERTSGGILSRWYSSKKAFVNFTPECRKFRRVHGLQFPLHPQQVIGWIVILVIVINTFVVITPLLEPSLRSIISIVISTIFFTHFCSHLIVLLLDPAHPQVRSQPTNKIIPEFDRGKHSHVIENGRCHLCNITTEGKRTKHCSICNKCIARFDHHCKWLNNCIGARNYSAFLVCLISAILANLFVAGLSAMELFLYLFPDRIANPQSSNMTMEKASESTAVTNPTILPVSNLASVILIAAIGILSAITAILLIHLCFFHGYIAYLGLTTYEYVRNKREKNTVAAAVAIAAAATAAAAAAAAATTATATATATATTTIAAATTTIATETIDTMVANTSTDSSTTVKSTTKKTAEDGLNVSESTVRRDFCGFVSSHLFASSVRNNINSWFWRYNKSQKRIIVERESNRIVLESSPISCRENENKGFQVCFPKQRELESRSNVNSMEFSKRRLSSSMYRGESPTMGFRNSVAIAGSMPSPVSCCFVAANSIPASCCLTSKKHSSKNCAAIGDSLDPVHSLASCCETVEGIGQLFLRTCPRRERRRRRLSNVQRTSKNKHMPTVASNRTENKTDPEDTTARVTVFAEAIAISAPRPPTKLPPLHYSLTAQPIDRSDVQTFVRSVQQQITGSLATKTTTIHARSRRTFSFRKRPKLKMKSRVTMQSVRLSPILESEFSKAAESSDQHENSTVQTANIWESMLGSPRYIVAPMVDASELAWRLMSRRHGAHLCYTPMLHSSVFCRDPKYRREALATTTEDRPLIVQFCGNDPNTLLEAALLAEPYCDAVDINIGCPQAIAKRGRYGAFLQDDWNLLRRIVNTLSKGLRVPVTCKLRVFAEIDKTVEYARMLENAGARLLTVHGRTREQKGPLTGMASWDHIRAVRQAVTIPVFANGNIQCLQDVEKCIEETGVHGVMSAEGNLYNPYIFEARYPPSWEPALEYLDLVERYPAPASYIRGHLFKLFQHTLCLAENKEERENLARNSTMESFKSVVYTLRDRYLPYHEGRLRWQEETPDYNLKLPPWLCQPYIRHSPAECVQRLETEKVETHCETAKRKFKDEEGNEISRKRLKKLRRIARRPNKQTVVVKRGSDLCHDCPNPVGLKCVHKLCRQCCRNKCFTENLDCIGHRNLTKTRRQMAIEFAAKRKTIDDTI